jgi:hypothetical protein
MIEIPAWLPFALIYLALGTYKEVLFYQAFPFESRKELAIWFLFTPLRLVIWPIFEMHGHGSDA